MKYGSRVRDKKTGILGTVGFVQDGGKFVVNWDEPISRRRRRSGNYRSWRSREDSVEVISGEDRATDHGS